MPNKSIDSIGPKPNKNNIKPVAEHKAGEVVRPKGAPTQAGESIKPKGYQAPKKLEATIGVTADEIKRVEKPRLRKKLMRKIGFVALVVGVLALIIFSFTQLQPGGYLSDKAYVGGANNEIVVTRDTAQALKNSLKTVAKNEGRKDFDANAETEKTIAMWVGLQDQSRQLGIRCEGEQRTQFLLGKNKLDQGLDEYYRVNEGAGRPREVVDFQDDIDCLKELMYSKLITQKQYSALTIRWDYFKLQNNNQVDEAAETKIRTRMQDEYLPLYQHHASNDVIATAVDDSYIKTDEQRVVIQQNYDGYQSNFRIYKNLSQAQAIQPFEQYQGEGEDNFTYINRLTNPGDYTPVFRSSTGYYAIFRLDSVSEAKYRNYDELLKEYEKNINFSFGDDIVNSTRLAKTAVWNSLVNIAQAAINCLDSPAHRINYYVRVVDVDTGVEVNGLKLTANTDRRNDVCSPVNGGFADDQMASSGGSLIGPNWHAQSVIDIIDNNEQGPNGAYGYRSDRVQLDCFGPRWRFIPEAPAGYSFVSVTGCHLTYYPCNPLATSVGYFAGQPYFDVQYDSGINGDLFTLIIRVKSNVPTTPLVRFQGYKVNEANNGVGPYAGAEVLIDSSSAFTKDIVNGSCTTANPGAQPYCIDGINASQNHIIHPTAVAGYEILGYKDGPSGVLVPSAQYNYVANSSANGTAINIWWVYRPIITQTSSVSCTSIAGTIAGPDGINIASEVLIGGESLGPTQGKSFNFAVPNHFRDGVSRAVTLRVTYTNGSLDYNLGNQVCPRSAQCIGTNLSSIFPGGRAALNVGDGQGDIKVSMDNDGQAIWSGFSRADSGRYQLGLTPESSAYWSMPVTNVPSNILPSQQLEFTTSVTLVQQPNDNSTPLNFTMTFVPNDGSAPVVFGSTCGTTLRILSSYGPWLRTQNGNVSAMGVIGAQEALTSSGGSLGGRRSTGSSNDDLNHESTYLTMSQNRNVAGVVGSGGGNGPFCSTNAYLLGRDDDDGTVNNTCTFSTYAFRLYASIAEGLRKGTPEEVIYNEAESAYNAASCSGTPALNGPGRYARGATGYNGSSNSSPGLIGGCPTITALQPTADGMRLGPNPTSPVGLLNVSSRGTIIVDGDLYINANIHNNATSAVTFNVDDLNGLNNVPNLGIIVKGNIIIDRDVTQIDASLYASGQIQTCDLYNPDITGSNNAGTTTGYKPEQTGGPTGPNSTAQACNKQLTIHGLAASKGGFKFGRNYVDFASIAASISLPNQYSQNFDYHTDRSVYYGKPAEDIIFNGLMLLAPPPAFEYLSNPDFASARYTTDSADPRL